MEFLKMEFNELIETRHSANNFLEDVQITVKDLEPIFEDIKLAPSAFNLQHAEYKVVLEKDLKEKIRKLRAAK